MSIMNFRKYDDVDFSFVQFLNDSRGSLGVPADVPFIQRSDEVFNSFASDISRSYIGDLVAILKLGTKVLIYNGQDDFVVNTPGVLNYLNDLNWVNTPFWKRAKKQVWTIHG